MSFRDLIGQEHVSRTLANAIARERVAHAFLFTGVRGVGKTTSARILAKALNCLEPVTAPEGGIEPCLACAACREIADGVDVDVREIDGASYTGVDEIRKLQESLPYRPARDRYKIFIVDEVHMLSQNAWNALLKTLEEPPPHVKFILATTEVHKVPVTILSRVQRFDFKMIPSRLIAERVRHVLAQEEIEADDRAVALVAREAAGSMRDALSLLDQVIAFSPKRLAGADVSRVLGVAGYTALSEIAEAVLRGDAGKAIEGVAELANQSCDVSVTARELLGLLRDLVVAKLCKDPEPLLDLADDERERVTSLAGAFDATDLLRVQRGFASGFDDVVRSPEPRTALEMLLARLALRPPLAPVDELLARLAELEARLAGGKPPPPGGGGRPAPGGGPPRGGSARPAASPADVTPGRAPSRAAPRGPAAEAAREELAARDVEREPRALPEALPGSRSPAPGAPTREPRAHLSIVAEPPRASEDEASRTVEPPRAHLSVVAEPPRACEEAPRAVEPSRPVLAALPQPSGPGAGDSPRRLRSADPSARQLEPRPAAARSRGSGAPSALDFPGDPGFGARAEVAQASSPAASGLATARPAAAARATEEPEPALDAAAEARFGEWRRVLDVLGQTRPDLVAILKHTAPLAIGPEAITLAYQTGNVLEAPMRAPECLAAVAAAAATCWGQEPKIAFQVLDAALPTLADTDRRERERERRAAVDRAERHPSVRDAVEILGARVKRIEIGERS